MTRPLTRPPLTRQTGFTLVELLVALTVFGALSIVMMAGYQLVVTTCLRIDATSEAGLERQAADETIRARLSLAYPGYQGDEGGAKLISFTGRADSVEFLAPLPDRFGAPALVWYRIGVGNDGGLHMAWRLDRGEESDTILMTGLGSASFSYFGGDGAGHQRRWSNAWVGQTQLPELVRLHLARDDGEAAAWPDLVVAPLLSASIECTFDQTDGKCRG